MTRSASSRASASARRAVEVNSSSLQKPVLRCAWWPISRFCSTVAYSNSSMFWKVRAMPISATRWGGTFDRSWPSNAMVPAVGT